MSGERNHLWPHSDLSPVNGPGLRDTFLRIGRVCLAALLLLAVSPRVAQADDVLQLLDGSVLHGALNGLEPGKTVNWKHPAALAPLQLKPDNLRQIRFGKAEKPPLAPNTTCRLTFDNGDEVFGNLVSMDADTVELDTAFAGRLRAPRSSVQSIRFLWKGFAATYEGPTSPDGWWVSPSKEVWRYEDNAFFSTAVGSLGRDVKLPGKSRIAFDMVWTGQLSLAMAIYTDSVERFDFGASSYMFYIGSGYVNIQRVQSGVGTTHIGQAQVPSMRERNSAKVEFRVNRDTATIALHVDGVFITQWRDQGGFVAKGTGICFFSQRMGPMVRVNNVRVSEWDGRDDAQQPDSKPNGVQVLYLVNNDQAEGKLLGVEAGRANLQTDFATLKVPVERITDIFMRPGQPTTNVLAGEVRAVFAGGGSVTFTIEHWSQDAISGINRNFGPVALKTAWVRRLQFNLNRAQALEESGFLRKDNPWSDD
ncbi:MAG: thiol-disulfide isomerase-like thioredoxin [Verrucomicrobia bacterium]|jgi:hypothetical protein|nr:thiol-disulfide isomerase-like thioredoxin [Verrucomicrobiota bacterium]